MIVAIGAEPLILPVPGVDQAKIAIEVLGKEDTLGDSVVLIGGGQVGCETALHLAKLGKKVTVVEMQSALAPDASTTGRNELMTEIDREPNFISLTGARCRASPPPASPMRRTATGQPSPPTAWCSRRYEGQMPRGRQLLRDGRPSLKSATASGPEPWNMPPRKPIMQL